MASYAALARLGLTLNFHHAHIHHQGQRTRCNCKDGARRGNGQWARHGRVILIQTKGWRLGRQVSRLFLILLRAAQAKAGVQANRRQQNRPTKGRVGRQSFA